MALDVSQIADLEPAGSVLGILSDRAVRCGLQIMVVGATARDILIRHVLGSPPERATADIDIAVAVSSWQDVECLTRNLGKRRGGLHAFSVSGVPVDVIPFGEIELSDRTIEWPNDHVMNVLGFREALAAAINVRLPGDVMVAVASLPAQSLLKLFAWRDRHHHDRRDAIDLRTILRVYSEGPYVEELYEGHEQLLVEHEFDVVLAGAARMGREANAILGPSQRSAVTALLSEDVTGLLAADMGGHISSDLSLLAAYRNGFG